MPEQPDGLTLPHVERNYVIGGWSDENENDPQTYGGICHLSVPYPFRPFCPFRPFPGQVYAAEQGGGTFTSVSELEEARIGVQTGTSFDKIIEEKLPDAHKEYYNNKADLLAALTGRKIDAFIVDEPVARLLLREHDGITCLPEYMNNYFFAPVFAKNDKGQALRSQFNDFLRQLPEQSLDMLAEKWFGEDEKAKDMPDIRDLPAKKGTLRMATAAGYAPFEYVRDGEIVGYDIELAAMFCEACGYGLEIVDMTFDGILPAVQTHKCDFASSGITITPERMESVLFSDPTFPAERSWWYGKKRHLRVFSESQGSVPSGAASHPVSKRLLSGKDGGDYLRWA